MNPKESLELESPKQANNTIKKVLSKVGVSQTKEENIEFMEQ